MFGMQQVYDLRGDRGGKKEKKKPKVDKTKNEPRRESMVVPSPAAKRGATDRPAQENSSSSDER
jgi:hypothetical protein